MIGKLESERALMIARGERKWETGKVASGCGVLSRMIKTF
jgi:hypothetical protein